MESSLDAESIRLKVNAYNRKRYRMSHPNCRARRPNHSPITKDFILKNVTKDKKTGCWNWNLSKAGGGYGRIHDVNGFVQAHRKSFELWKRPIPKNLFGCHHCDNRKCVNPDHIFIGSASDNMKDARKKSRVIIPNRKLTDGQAELIRNDKRMGIEIAKEYGVSPQCICRIRRGNLYQK